jgi:diguanylate cyclase (GGDEF)-like protein/PAS domain S-box-containing protein
MTTPILEARLRIALDAPHRALDVSASIRDLLGYGVEDFTGGAIALRDRIHADDQDIAERLFSPADAPCAGAANLRLRQANGRIRCVKVPYVKVADQGRIILDLCVQDAKSLPRTLTDAAATVNFRAMMENTDDYIYFKDRNHVLTGASQTLVSLCDPAEHWTDLLGQTDYDVFPEAYADIYYRLEKRVFGGEPVAQEIQGYLTKDGRQGWVDNRKYPIRDEQGEIVGLYGIARDVTRQRRLREMLLAIADFVSLDHGDHCFERMVAFAAERFSVDFVHIGLLQPDDAHVRIVAGWRDGAPVAPGHVYALAGTPCEHVLRRSHQCHGEHVRRHFPQDLDLAELDAEAYVGEPIADASGQVLGLIVLVSRRPLADVDDIAAGLRILAARAGADLTRRQHRHSLQQANERLQLILDHAPIGIWLQDGRGRMLFVNKAFCDALGIAEAAFLALPHDAPLIPEAFRQQCIDSDLEALSGSGVSVTHQRLPFVDGRIHDLRVIKAVKRDAQGRALALVGLSLDITDIVQAQQRVADNEKLLREVLALIHEGVWDWHVPSGRVTHNAQWYASLRVAPGEVAETLDAFTRLIHPDDRDLVRQRIDALLRGETDNYYSEHRLLCGDGSEIWVHDRGRVVERDAAGAPVRVVGSFADISYQRKHQQQLEHVAHYDALSGLPNRVLLADRLQQAMVQAQRRGEQLAVVYLDLDGFKAVNDQFGHDAGDRLLVTLADRMKRALREGDTLARLGGDEFVAVLVDLKSTESCLPLLIRLLKTIAQPVHDVVGVLHVSASLGVSFYPQAEPIDADQLLRQADQAMYQAKLAGKNRYHLFDTAHDRDLRGRHATIERLGEALARQEFVLHFQPKVHMRAGRVIGVEALLRWQHPQRGLLPPAAFLPALDNHALMVRLGDWVIDTALAQTAAWRAAGLVLPVSVNVDALQLSQADFVDKLRAALARHPQLQPGDLELEVLETSALQDMAGISRILAEVQALGVRFSLDDFGTGYSSLAYLKRLPVDTLKIDQSFVRDMLDDPEDLAILEGVIGLAGAFRRRVIAEGVECEAHGEMLLHLGCELGQGYAIARPMSAALIPGWLQIWRPGASWLSAGRADQGMQPAVFALAEHRAWVRMLYRYLNDETAAPPPLDQHHCNFGHWLDQRLATDRVRGDAYSSLAVLHDEVHRIAVELVGLKQRGEVAAALERFREIENVREALSAALRALISAAARG